MSLLNNTSRYLLRELPSSLSGADRPENCLDAARNFPAYRRWCWR
jgi:hypothetical protein